MKKIPLLSGWQFRRRESTEEWQEVCLPHDACLYEPRSQKSAGGTNTGWVEGRSYEYRTFLSRPEDPDEACLFLEFEGVNPNAAVYLNGEKIAEEKYGYTGFTVDLTGKLRAGRENEILVTADNSAQPNSRWYSGAGIYRPVFLYTAPLGHILKDSVKITVRKTDPAELTVEAKTSCPGQVTFQILAESERNEKVLSEVMPESEKAESGLSETILAEGESWSDGSVSFQITLPRALLWQPEDPVLYCCRLSFKEENACRKEEEGFAFSSQPCGEKRNDRACGKEKREATSEDTWEETFGIRTISWGTEGFLLNGKPFLLKGACIHHDNGLLGAREYADAEERKIRLLKETGYNAIRSAHNPCSPELLSACDKLGMLVLDEYADAWYIHKTKYDCASFVPEEWRKDLAALVKKDRNHPSVIIYSLGNEVSETAQKRGIRMTEEMTEYLHSLDPTRPVTCGVNIFFNLLSSLGLGIYSDKKAEKEAERGRKISEAEISGQKEKAAQSKLKTEVPAGKEKAVGSKFFNDLAGIFGSEVMKRGACLHGCDVKTREAFAALDIAGYNYGILRCEKDLKKYPDRLILGTETFAEDAFRFMELAEREPRLIGDFVWAGIDYLGETGIGAWEYSDYAPVPSDQPGWVSAGSGRLDLTGKPLGEAYYTRVALKKDPGPFLAVCPVNHTGEPHSPSAWKMTNALDSWSWHGCQGRPADVEIYARAARGELFVNGKKVSDFSFRHDCRAKVRIPYEDGCLEAVTFDVNGKEIGRCRLITAGEETVLKAEPETACARAGHLLYVRLRYTDQNGITKPLLRGQITVKVSGGKLLGVGSGCPYQTLPFTGNRTDTWHGEAMAIVMAEKASFVRITADDGKYAAETRVPVLDQRF